MIYLLRRHQGISQTDLAAMVGMKSAHLSLIEHGKRSPRPGTLAKFAEAFGISEQIFYGQTVSDLEAVSANELIRIGSILLKEGRERKKAEK